MRLVHIPGCSLAVAPVMPFATTHMEKYIVIQSHRKSDLRSGVTFPLTCLRAYVDRLSFTFYRTIQREARKIGTREGEPGSISREKADDFEGYLIDSVFKPWRDV